MAEEMNSDKGDIKQAKISGYITRGIKQHLSQNADIYGDTHIESVTLSADGRSAYVAICSDKGKAVLPLLKNNMSNIIKCIKKEFRARYFPKIYFKLDDEKTDF